MQDKGVIQRVIVTPDKHFPLADAPAINCLTQTIRIVQPDTYIDLGDIGEWQSVSKWQWKKKKRPPLEYQLPYIDNEIRMVNECVDIIDEALDDAGVKEKYLCEGNHDDWLNRFVDENPYLEEYVFKDALRIDERGYDYYPIGKYLKIGKLYFYHGHHFGGMYHTANHLRRLGCNIMYGHHHSLQQDSVTHMDGAKSAWSIGCLKDMSDDTNIWLGRRKHKWSHAFAIVDYFEDGKFTVHIIQIINGKCSLWGELIDGNI